MGRIVLDLNKCSGCRVCEAVCSLTHEGEFNPVKSRIKVVRTVDRQIAYSVPVFCLHCEEASCEAVCPAHAINRTVAGKLIVDEKKCIGCKLCEIACPVGAISVNPEKKVAIKCDACADLEEGPQCVRYCWWGALTLLPEEKVGNALARAKAEKFIEIERRS